MVYISVEIGEYLRDRHDWADGTGLLVLNNS